MLIHMHTHLDTLIHKRTNTDTHTYTYKYTRTLSFFLFLSVSLSLPHTYTHIHAHTLFQSFCHFLFLIISLLLLLFIRQLIEKSRELSKKSKELEDLKGANSVYLASLEKRYIDETALYKKRSGIEILFLAGGI